MDLDEKELLIRAMCSANLPKFLKEDKDLFECIVRDLYPDVQLKPLNMAFMEEAVCYILDKQQKSITAQFNEKLLQFFDTSNLRFGVMLVGPPNGGKTTI